MAAERHAGHGRGQRGQAERSRFRSKAKKHVQTRCLDALKCLFQYIDNIDDQLRANIRDSSTYQSRFLLYICFETVRTAPCVESTEPSHQDGQKPACIRLPSIYFAESMLCITAHAFGAHRVTRSVILLAISIVVIGEWGYRFLGCSIDLQISRCHLLNFVVLKNHYNLFSCVSRSDFDLSAHESYETWLEKT